MQFITQLKENEQQNIEKWTLEKLLTEQAITELSASCDKFKAECQRAWDECQIYKRACENNGILPDEIKERQRCHPRAQPAPDAPPVHERAPPPAGRGRRHEQVRKPSRGRGEC